MVSAKYPCTSGTMAPDGHMYCIVLDMIETGIYYNKDLFDQLKLSVPRDTEIPALLARMTGHDQVTSFSYQPPSLSDLFREAVRR